MKTDELIEQLSSKVEPVSRSWVQRRLALGLLAGAAIGYLCKHNATLSGAEGG